MHQNSRTLAHEQIIKASAPHQETKEIQQKNCLLQFNRSSHKLLGRASRSREENLCASRFQHQPPAISSKIGISQFQLMSNTTSAGRHH
ncbi:hypothetical protein Nepgr_026848 [Nepenthes gracilis]|uniref:Uncharacterized protein n=1 Tax=Nepenthes gracilis TaxID=150966 RepID=A0AAD3Y2E9_NEPGR|nr:hypothetical protein Nepgr_026848 [Nepenthes gracilis]